jgi:hypothetical protein
MSFRITCALTVCIFVTSTLLLAQNPSSAKPASRAGPHRSVPESISGALHGDSYRNVFFGFSYQVPFGWVDRTEDMGEGDNQPARAQVLLAVFERPPAAVGKTVNSAVVITAENISAYKGLKTAAAYFESIMDAATAQGFKVTSQPYEYQVGSKPLVRGDFTAQRSTQTIYQSSLVTLRKGYVVSFTVVGGSGDEVNELIDRLKP